MRDLPPRSGQPPVAPGAALPRPADSPRPADPPRAARTRLDTALVRRGLARSRTHAARLVADGRVLVGARAATRPAQALTEDAELSVVGTDDFASRAGGKLDGALDAFAGRAPLGPASGATVTTGPVPGGVRVDGRRCLDAGASTGGFTDVLLRRGAASVVAVDVGTGQLRPELAADPRVDAREGTDVRGLTAQDLPAGPVDLVVADLSFISLTKVLPALSGLVAATGDLLLLVKPQFEVGRAAVGRGVVSDPELWRQAVESVAAAALELGWTVVSEVTSSVPGRAGNREFVLWLRRAEPGGIVATKVPDGTGRTDGGDRR